MQMGWRLTAFLIATCHSFISTCHALYSHCTYNMLILCLLPSIHIEKPKYLKTDFKPIEDQAKEVKRYSVTYLCDHFLFARNESIIHETACQIRLSDTFYTFKKHLNWCRLFCVSPYERDLLLCKRWDVF